MLTIPMFILSLSGLCLISATSKPIPHKKWTMHIQHYFGKEKLELGKPYTNSLGEALTINRCRYYLSNFSVTDSVGHSIKLPANYFLVDASDSVSASINLSIPLLKISSIRFLLGVDSLRNVSGIQSGALDPVKGMFWTWNSGYIMAQLEGTAPVAATPGHRFIYHIGGYKNEQNAARYIDIKLDKNENELREINIQADINKWFKGEHIIKIAETPVCETPGNLAINIADNYSHFFSNTFKH